MSATKVNQPPVKALIARPPVYRRRFAVPDGSGDKAVAEFHTDKIVIRRHGGRARFEMPFAQLWRAWKGSLL